MNIAIVAATHIELQLIREMRFKDLQPSFFIHGTGMIAAAFHIGQTAAQQPDLMIQCGIAGSYSTVLSIGDTVVVESEVSDQGAEDDENLLSVFDLGLLLPDEYPYENGLLPCPFLSATDTGFRKVKGLTVSCVTGKKETAEKRRSKFGADIETMEGAALHYTGLISRIPFLQIRTISNYVEKRNKQNWNIPLALENNANAVKKIIESL